MMAEEAAFEMAEAAGSDQAFEAEASGAEMFEEIAGSEFAFVETDGVAANVAASARRAPACELRLRVEDVDAACKLIRDLAEEYEGAADVQRLEDGGANVYAEVSAADAEDFLSALKPLGDIEGETRLPESDGSGAMLILLSVLEG